MTISHVPPTGLIGLEEWEADHTPGTFPTLEQQLNFATASSNTVGLTLGSTPSTGHVIFIASCQTGAASVTTVTGGGATWTRLRGEYVASGAYVMTDLFMGIVGVSPSTSVTVNWSASGTYYVAAAVYSGLLGLCENTSGRAYISNNGQEHQPSAPVMTPVRSPLALCVAFMRGQGSPTMAGGYTNITTGSAGGDRAFFAYKNVSGPAMAAPELTGATLGSNHAVISALVG